MRVTGGEFGGRRLKVPEGEDIRPTQDRVREALFSILSPEIAGCRFLDLYAGSGSVGIEALSRGAESATFVESSRRHVAALKENIQALSIPPARAVVACMDADAWISSYRGDGFGIAFADPPYSLWRDGGLDGALTSLAERGVVAAGGLFVSETGPHVDPPRLAGWDLLRDRTYGITRIAIWRRVE